MCAEPIPRLHVQVRECLRAIRPVPVGQVEISAAPVRGEYKRRIAEGKQGIICAVEASAEFQQSAPGDGHLVFQRQHVKRGMLVEGHGNGIQRRNAGVLRVE